MKRLKHLGFACLILLAAGFAQAETIVDTGPGPLNSSGSALAPVQRLAGQFTLNQPSTITDIDGWISPRVLNTTFTVAIYGHTGTLPDSTQYFSQQYNVGKEGTCSSEWCQPTWHGPSGLNFSLDAGTYWVAFEVRADDTFNGAMPYSAELPLYPLAAYAFDAADYPDGSGWRRLTHPVGVRILGAPTSVPEPTTMLLLGFGLAGVAGVRKFRR